MSDQETVSEQKAAAAAPPLARRKFPWAILVVAALFVVVPFISWYGTWFGRPLSDSQLENYLRAGAKPRNVQHALSQIAGGMMKHDESVKRWYPAVISAAGHESPVVRLTAAWTMGNDNGCEEFHPVLLGLLEDPHPGVRHNAALSLVRFNDDRARPELMAMLASRRLRAESSGTVAFIVKEEGAAVAEGAPLVRTKDDAGRIVELRAAEAARVEAFVVADGVRVEAGEEVMVLSPDTEQLWEALRALFVVGRAEDIAQIERYTRAIPGVPDRVGQQAALTIEAIRNREGEKK